MRFFELNEIQHWCAERGIESDVNGGLAQDTQLRHTTRAQDATGQRSGHERDVAAACLRALGQWDECVLWVTLTGVWGSGEDWPAYYAMRGRVGERRSLEKAPGHWFQRGDEDLLLQFLTAVLENAWDAYVLPASSGRETDRRLRVSHDEYVELQSRSAVESDALAV